jgi:hypothetical protein
MSEHWTQWEDSQQAKVMCGNVPVGIFSAYEPELCTVCGKRIVLQWNVRVEEVDDE